MFENNAVTLSWIMDEWQETNPSWGKKRLSKNNHKKILKPLKSENYSQYWFTCINHYLLEKTPKNQRMNTRVLLEHVIYAELLLLIVITWPVLEFAINKIEFRYDLVFIPCTVFASWFPCCWPGPSSKHEAKIKQAKISLYRVMIVHYIVASYIVWCWPIFPTKRFLLDIQTTVL